jgi:DNA-binding beta-propeller fold protein YncE
MNQNFVAWLKRPLVLACTLVLTSLAVSVSPALAARGHVFCEQCSFTPEGAHAFKEPSGVAVNEATGDVYVVDKGNNRVEYFTAKGEYQGEFNGSTTPATSFDKPEGIAVDNSCVLRHLAEPKCKEEDSSSGDVYVVDAGHSVVDNFSATGEYRGQITEAEAGNEELTGVAVDAVGTVGVLSDGHRVYRFSDMQPNVSIGDIVLVAFSFVPAGPSLAIDSEGNFYFRLRELGPKLRVQKNGPTGAELIEEIDHEESSAVAANQVTNQSFVDNLTTVRVSEPEGTEAERLGEEAGVKHLVQGTGVAVNAGAGSSEGSGSVYVADAGTGQVVVFGLTEPAVPSVGGESVSEVSADSADLGAEVDPNSEPGEQATAYRFEYGPCLTATTCAESGYGSETPAKTLAAGFEVQAVSVHVAGLTASTTYHFRALANNGHGEATPGLEQVFTTQSAGGPLVLPDNRGWELVSPPDKQGSLIEPIEETGVVQAAADGDGVTYLANAPTEADPEGYANEVQVLSRRGMGGTPSWSSLDIAIPHPAAAGKGVGAGPEYSFFNPDLTLSAVQPAGEFNPLLSGEASESTAYLHVLTVPAEACTPATSCYVPLVTRANDTADQPFGEAEKCLRAEGSEGRHAVCGPRFQGATEDLSHVVLSSKAPLTPNAGFKQLYEWSAGALAHVTVLSGGEPAPEDAHLGSESEGTRGAISSDGTRIVWSTPDGLYQRDTAPPGSTVQLDKAEEPMPGHLCGECESGGGSFQFASSDGTRVFFTDEHKLTEDSGARSESGHLKADLYEYDFNKPVGERLTDVTPKHGAESAEVQGGILGASTDGEYVYFVADGVQSETPNSRGQSAQPGHPNLYLRHGTSTIFITTLASGDANDWNEGLPHQPTRVSPNGQFLELMSEARLTGYDNRDVATGKPAAEVYLYDATANSLVCASCDPTGARPVGVEYEKLDSHNGGLVGGHDTWKSSALVAANVPGWTVSIGITGARYQPRYLSNSGRLFFNTVNALVPQDVNGTQDVYEYEPLGLENTEGKSVCEASNPEFSAASGGCVSLISSGASAQESAFMDASESGDDVFFLTSAKLSPLDVDTSRDIYDAHVCTTAEPCITFPNAQSPPCTTEASCKAAPTPQPSIFGSPSSQTFQGLGNPAPAAAVKAKAKPLTRAQKLAAALKVCKKDRSKAKRAKCEKTAHKNYGPLKRAKAKGKKKGK